MHGLRYSLDLSPVIEGPREGVRDEGAHARGGARGHSTLRNELPIGGKFGRALASGAPEAIEGDEWASESDEGLEGAEGAAAASADWDGAWQPPVDGFGLFDERQDERKETAAPSFSEVSNYIRALCQSARMGAEASVVALAYIERVVSSAAFPLHGGTWRRCCLTAWLLASKMWDDECLENPQYAELFGYEPEAVNALEQAFVEAMDYRLALSPAEYARYYFALRSICQTSTEAFPLRPLDAEL